MDYINIRSLVAMIDIYMIKEAAEISLNWLITIVLPARKYFVILVLYLYGR